MILTTSVTHHGKASIVTETRDYGDGAPVTEHYVCAADGRPRVTTSNIHRAREQAEKYA